MTHQTDSCLLWGGLMPLLNDYHNLLKEEQAETGFTIFQLQLQQLKKVYVAQMFCLFTSTSTTPIAHKYSPLQLI